MVCLSKTFLTVHEALSTLPHIFILQVYRFFCLFYTVFVTFLAFENFPGTFQSRILFYTLFLCICVYAIITGIFPFCGKPYNTDIDYDATKFHLRLHSKRRQKKKRLFWEDP